ncbi:MAG: undecaprenyl-diphosphate phosphatase [Phycisphaerales bacterium]|nr:undecaprenyl-diphosphate phosphatase [Phycisphaerales bacterium]
MTPLAALILGLVEGITEYLPVSSTGHLIIASWLLGLDRPPEVKQAVDAFNIIIQGGAILAVLGLYRARVGQMLRGLAGRDVAGRRLFLNLVVAFLPAAVLGPPLDDLIEAHLFKPVPVIAALAVGGVVLLGIKRWQDRLYGAQEGHGAAFIEIESMGWRQALVVGLLQCVAMWPGTSRSMMTIVGGMAVGLRPRQAAEFSFLLGLPTLGAACLYKLAKSLRSDGFGFIEALGGWLPITIGLVAATVSAAIAIKWLVSYLSRHGMSIFGWYRLVLAAVLAGLIWGGGLELVG